MKILNPYVLIKGELVHVEDSRITSGFSKTYICPDLKCRNPLTARKGQVKRAHFAHQQNVECNGLETALHLKSKEIIENLNTFFIPKHGVFCGEVYDLFKSEIILIEKKYEYPLLSNSFPQNIYFSNLFNWDDFLLFDDKLINIKDYEIQSEVLFEGLKPDLKFMNKINGEYFYVEIAVTSFIKEDKMNLIKQKNLTVLEIGLSDIYKNEFFKEEKEFENILINIFSSKRNYSFDFSWIFQYAKYNWINLKDEKILLIKKKEKFVKIFKERLKVVYDFYNNEFLEFCKENHDMLNTMSHKELIQKLQFYYDFDYEKERLLGRFLEFLKEEYYKTDIAKESNKFYEVGESRETKWNKETIVDLTNKKNNIADRNKKLQVLNLNKLIAKYGKVKADIISKGVVEIGMNRQMCLDSWGKPLDANRTKTKEGDKETLIYSWVKILYLENGILTKIEC